MAQLCAVCRVELYADPVLLRREGQQHFCRSGRGLDALQRNTVLLHRRAHCAHARVADFRDRKRQRVGAGQRGLVGIVIVPIALAVGLHSAPVAGHQVGQRQRRGVPGQIFVRQEQLIIQARHKGMVVALFKVNAAAQFNAVIQHQRAVLPAAVLQCLFYGVLAGADGVEPGQAVILARQHQADAQPVAVVEDLPQCQGVGTVGGLGGGFHRLGVFVQLLTLQRNIVVLPAAVQPAEQAAHYGQLLGHSGRGKVDAAQPHGQTGHGGCGHPSPREPAVPGGLFLRQPAAGSVQHAGKLVVGQRGLRHRLVVQRFQQIHIKIFVTHGCTLPSRSVHDADGPVRGSTGC